MAYDQDSQSDLEEELRSAAYEAEEDEFSSVNWPMIGRRTGKMLYRVYSELDPDSEEEDKRVDIIDFMDTRVATRIPDCEEFTPFGSYTMDMFFSDSDLDLSMNLHPDAESERKIEDAFYLRKLNKALHTFRTRGLVHSIVSVYNASVPVVKFVHKETGIQCDVSVENKKGVFKSLFFKSFCDIDDRFRHLCFLLKQWAKHHKVNKPSAGTLSSYALTLLVAFHLQTCSPPILPPISRITEDLEYDDYDADIIQARNEMIEFHGYSSAIQTSVAELFRGFFVKMVAVKYLWEEGLCASVYDGDWISTEKDGSIVVEDFVDDSNAARSVSREGFALIYRMMEESLELFKRPIGAAARKNELFGL